MSDSATPTSRADRIGMLDTTRGIAVLGILLMNIVGLGLPDAYEDPTNWGGATGANLAAWRITSLFFEGTMRGLFTLLFGAGALLFLQRHTTQSYGQPGAMKLYYRRTVLLIAFGLINAYVLLWEGDILFYYGVIGLVLHAFRKLSTRWLLITGLAILAIPTVVKIMDRADYIALQERAETAESLRESGQPLNAQLRFAIDELRWTNESHKPSLDEQEIAIQQVARGYASAARYFRTRTMYLETYFFSEYIFAEFLGMMLIGMALLKLGVLTGEASHRTYLAMAWAGYLLGSAVNLWEIQRLESSDFSVPAIMDSYVTYDLGRVLTTAGHVGLIGLLWQSAWFAGAKRQLGAVGQMALSNYLSQSVLCLFVFTGAGLGWFGQLQRYQLYYVVAAIWLMQLLWSSWWLQRFQFGPAEWLWRTLTYGRRPPMRISAAPAPSAASIN
ncbi:MAG TPA: DUF418 domain-containing protein [Povalibacter sp.]